MYHIRGPEVMTLVIALKRKFLSLALQPFQSAMREQSVVARGKSILYQIYPQRCQSPTGDVLKKREGRPGWLSNPVHLLEDGSRIPQSCSTNCLWNTRKSSQPSNPLCLANPTRCSDFRRNKTSDVHLPDPSFHRKGSFKGECRVPRKTEDKAETPVSFQDSSLFMAPRPNKD